MQTKCTDRWSIWASPSGQHIRPSLCQHRGFPFKCGSCTAAPVNSGWQFNCHPNIGELCRADSPKNGEKSAAPRIVPNCLPVYTRETRPAAFPICARIPPPQSYDQCKNLTPCRIMF